MTTFTFNDNFHFQWLQLRKLEMHLNNPQMSSDEYRAEARVTFWKMVTMPFMKISVSHNDFLENDDNDTLVL